MNWPKLAPAGLAYGKAFLELPAGGDLGEKQRKFRE
jgi:hypothetical protein